MAGKRLMEERVWSSITARHFQLALSLSLHHFQVAPSGSLCVSPLWPDDPFLRRSLAALRRHTSGPALLGARRPSERPCHYTAPCRHPSSPLLFIYIRGFTGASVLSSPGRPALTCRHGPSTRPWSPHPARTPPHNSPSVCE